MLANIELLSVVPVFKTTRSNSRAVIFFLRDVCNCRVAFRLVVLGRLHIQIGHVVTDHDSWPVSVIFVPLRVVFADLTRATSDAVKRQSRGRRRTRRRSPSKLVCARACLCVVVVAFVLESVQVNDWVVVAELIKNVPVRARRSLLLLFFLRPNNARRAQFYFDTFIATVVDS